jgi:hypothetical protein
VSPNFGVKSDTVLAATSCGSLCTIFKVVLPVSSSIDVSAEIQEPSSSSVLKSTDLILPNLSTPSNSPGIKSSNFSIISLIVLMQP